MDGWMDGWMEGWMDGWMGEKSYLMDCQSLGFNLVFFTQIMYIFCLVSTGIAENNFS
jgi:hypothetical protein